MTARRERRETIKVAAIFILLEIAAASLLHSSSQMQNIWINRASHKVAGAVWGGSEKVRKYFSLKEQNAALAQENFELMQRLHLLESALHNMPDTLAGQYEYKSAKVVKLSSNSLHNFIVLDKGSLDGVEPRDGVITSHGAVGIVHAVSRNYSYAMAFTNSNISVSARLGQDGPAAPLSWDGKSLHTAVLTGIPLGWKASRKDTIYTSGLSSIFPAGIPLGVAVGKKTADGATDIINVSLFEDMSSLDYVTIVKNLGRDEIDAIIEEQQKEDRK